MAEKGTPSPGKRQSPLFGGGSLFTVMEGSFFGAFRKALLPLKCSSLRLEDFQVPRVVVVGGESTGKSSLLENVTKCAVFPRNRDICTRMPIRLQLTNATDGTEGFVEVQFGSMPPQRLQDSSAILGAVEAQMDALPKNDICDTEMVIRIREPCIPTFEFVDLPGIRAYPPDLVHKTERLVRKYLTGPNTLVISVVRATDTRITNDRGYALVQELGLENRTVMALTRTDRVSPEEFQEMVLDRIYMRSSEFQRQLFACIAIVNRTSDDVVTLAEHQGMEEQWFESHVGRWYEERPLEERVDMASRMTLFNLVRRVDTLYSEFISSHWKPRALKLIDSKQVEMASKIFNLGPPTYVLTEKTVLEEVQKEVQRLVNAQPFGLLVKNWCADGSGRFECAAHSQDHRYPTVIYKCEGKESTNYIVGSSKWAEWVRARAAEADTLLQQLKKQHERQRLGLPELLLVVDQAFKAETPTKPARFEQLRCSVHTWLEEEYDRLLEACAPRLESVAEAAVSSLYTSTFTCNPPASLHGTPAYVINCFLLAHVVYPAMDALGGLASETKQPVECESVIAQRKSLNDEVPHLTNARNIIQGLQSEGERWGGKEPTTPFSAAAPSFGAAPPFGAAFSAAPFGTAPPFGAVPLFGAAPPFGVPECDSGSGLSGGRRRGSAARGRV